MNTNCIAKNSASHDVLIVGGGAVGLSLALALRSVNVSVAVVESRYHRESAARTIAVSAGSVDFLHQLQCMERHGGECVTHGHHCGV